MSNMFNYEDRFCPIANREIGAEICFEIGMCLTAGLNPASVPEVEFTNDEATRRICDACPYSDEE